MIDRRLRLGQIRRRRIHPYLVQINHLPPPTRHLHRYKIGKSFDLARRADDIKTAALQLVGPAVNILHCDLVGCPAEAAGWTKIVGNILFDQPDRAIRATYRHQGRHHRASTVGAAPACGKRIGKLRSLDQLQPEYTTIVPDASGKIGRGYDATQYPSMRLKFVHLKCGFRFSTKALVPSAKSGLVNASANTLLLSASSSFCPSRMRRIMILVSCVL